MWTWTRMFIGRSKIIWSKWYEEIYDGLTSKCCYWPFVANVVIDHLLLLKKWQKNAERTSNLSNFQEQNFKFNQTNFK